MLSLPDLAAKSGPGWKGSFDQAAAEVREYAAAGVLLFAVNHADGQPHVLLAVQRARKGRLELSPIGGKVKPADGCDPRRTAAREVHEETHGLLDEALVAEALTHCGGVLRPPAADLPGVMPPAAAQQGGGVSAPYTYVSNGRYVMFAAHLPDAWDLPAACAARLAACGAHRDALKVVGLTWLSLQQLARLAAPPRGPPPDAPPATPPTAPPDAPPDAPPSAPPDAPPGAPPGAPPSAPPGALPGTPHGAPPGAPPSAPPGALPGTPPGAPPRAPPACMALDPCLLAPGVDPAAAAAVAPNYVLGQQLLARMVAWLRAVEAAGGGGAGAGALPLASGGLGRGDV